MAGKDAPVARIVNGQTESNFDAVGIVNGGCTGTLISPTHLLTAAHCVEEVGATEGTFEVNGNTYETSRITVHPDYNADRFDVGYDIAIMELSRPVAGVTAMEINRTRPEVGTSLTLVGFGMGGTTDRPVDDFGNKRVGETELERVTQNHLIWNFDGDEESNTAPGDSGGPAFVNVNGTPLIAGITSGGDGDAHSLGDRSFDTRVDTLADWIDNVVENTEITPDVDPDTEPTEPIDDPIIPEQGEDLHSDDVGDDATAISLTDGFADVFATINTADDVDVFRFEIEGPRTVLVHLAAFDGDLDTLLKIVDTEGEIVLDNDNSYGTTDSSIQLELDAGSYYIVASSANASSQGDYWISMDRFPTDEPDGNEHKDDPLGDDELLVDSGDGSSDDDWGTVDLDSASIDQWDVSGFWDDCDLNHDNDVSALDALMVINHLGRSVALQGTADSSAGSADKSRLDANGDGVVSALDALMVINRMGQQQALTPQVNSKAVDGLLRQDPGEDDFPWCFEAGRRGAHFGGHFRNASE